MAEVNAEIPLSVYGGAKGPSSAGWNAPSANPLATISSVADVIGKLNAIKEFNAEFGAKQKAGEVLALAPSLEEGIASLSKYPDIQAFAPKIAQEALTTRNSSLEAQSREMKLGLDAFHTALGGLSAVAYDPGQMKTLKRVALENSSPAIRDRLSKSLDYVESALNAAPDASKRLQLLTGWATAGGWAEAMKAVNGTPFRENTGGQIVGGVQAPAQGAPPGSGIENGGAFKLNSSVGNSLAPQQGQQGAAIIGGGTGNVKAPGSSGGVPTGNSLAPVGPPPVVKQAGAGPAPEPAPSKPEELLADGKPLLPKNFNPKGQTPSPGYVGGKTPQQAQQASKLMEHFSTDGFKKYNDAQTALGLLDEMDNNFDKLEAEGGFIRPGVAGEQRLAIGNTLNLISRTFGGEPIANPSAAAAGEDLVKGTQRMGANLVNQLFGTQREAAKTIEDITKAVPAINNTYLGGKLITSLIRAGVQRSMAEHEFYQKYQEKTQGDLTGADIEFAKAHPMEGFVKPVLEKFGLNSGGFKNKEALRDAVKNKWLTPQQAVTIAKQQGFKLGE